MKRTRESKAEQGRPAVYGSKMVSRSVALPESAWKELDDEAYEQRISTNERLRRRLGIKPAPARKRTPA